MKINSNMKKVLLLIGVIAGVAAFSVAFGQTQGAILYESRINVHVTLPPGSEHLKDQVPQYRVVKEQLVFNETESLFRPVIEDEPEDMAPVGGGVVFRMQRPMSETYVDQSTMRILRQEEFLGKKYLIEDSLSLVPWKMEAGTREINGYVCRRATYYNEETRQNTVAWYTDQLRPFLGPPAFNTLPGAVLEIDVNEGQRVTRAVAIELRPLKNKELKAPASGTRIQRAEFDKLREQELERIRANGGNVFIRN